jgi:hypothetical protein
VEPGCLPQDKAFNPTILAARGFRDKAAATG